MLPVAALLAALSYISGAQAQACSPKSFDLTSDAAVAANFDVTSGSANAYNTGPSGLTLQITPDSDNIVLTSHEQWSSPMTLDVTMKGTSASGIISCLVLWTGVTGTDEIDLELMGGITGDFMAPIWPDGRTVGFGDDVGVESSMKATNWPWVYEVPGFDSSQENDYSITWTDSEITWTINGRHVTTYTKKSENNWINSPVNLRLGVWSTGEGANWAGEVDWAQSGSPVEATITSLSISC